MLELACADRSISVSDASVIMGLPQTTALRHLTLLTSHGWVERHPDAIDKRRVNLILTQAGAAAVATWMRAMDRDTTSRALL